jgi:hypothetical protein
MTTNRLLTTAVQLVLLVSVVSLWRMAWPMLKEDVTELTKDLR